MPFDKFVEFPLDKFVECRERAVRLLTESEKHGNLEQTGFYS